MSAPHHSVSAAVDRDLAAMAELSQRIAEQMGVPAQAPAAEDAPAAQDAPPGEQARPAQHGPRLEVARASGMVRGGSPESQRAHLDDLVRRYTAKTPTSKRIAQRYRRVLADSRAAVGFRSSTKEMLYPIAGRRAKGSWLEDVDGNRYVDITMGFGVLLFGHEPAFVSEAVREHLSRGVQLGPRNVETGEAAELLAELTGMERVAFANSGTEANSAAIRLARAATGRTRIITFEGAYHGHNDNVLGRSPRTGGEGLTTVPMSAGVPQNAVADLLVLPYGSEESLAVIERQADGIAAVVVEPVQSRHPALQPAAFVRRLRELTARHGIVLLFDEMLTGFRPAPRGAQELYGVTPDLATYGKLLGGGFPIGAIAGRADIMDGIDGGYWSYGDDSYPQADTTFFGGTYIQHPVSMVAARAVLAHLKEHSPRLQERLNARTDELAGTLNSFFEAEEFALSMSHFGSMFRFEHRADMELLYHHLMLRGVHVWEWRNFFLSTEHSDGDVEFIADAVKGSLRELRDAGFFRTKAKTRPMASVAPVASVAAVAKPQAMAWNGAAAAAAAPARPVAPRPRPRPLDFGVYFFGDYPQDEKSPRHGKYDHLLETARFADRNGFHSLWIPERHFHSFGGLFPNPVVLAAALARETDRVRINAGSVVLPLHDPIRVAEEWSMVDNLSGGRVGIGCASGWHANDFVFFPERFGSHKETMYEQVAQVRRLWRGESVRRTTGAGESDLRLFPRPVQDAPPMYTAVVGNPASYELAARHDLGIVTNLMTQGIEQLRENIARYRRTRAEHGLDPEAGRVAVLLHTYLAEDHAAARAEAREPLSRYMRASLSLFGGVANSLGHQVDLSAMSEDDLDVLFRRAYDRYCDQRALIGSPESVRPVVEEVRAAGADEVVALVDFGVAPTAMRSGLTHLNALRSACAVPAAFSQGAVSAPGPTAAASAPTVVSAPGPAPAASAPTVVSGLATASAASAPAVAPAAVTVSAGSVPAAVSASAPTAAGSVPTAESAFAPTAAASAPTVVSAPATAPTAPAPTTVSASAPVPAAPAPTAAALTPTAAPAPAPGTAPAPAPGTPLSPGQQRIWFLERMLPGRTAYNETKAIELEGPLDVGALRAALHALVERHEQLRTVFREVGGEARQFARKPGEVDFAVVDGTAAGGDAVADTLKAESERRFDLAEGPLFVTRLVRLGAERHVLILSLHHIVMDAASAAVLARDLSALYRARLAGAPDAGLPALTRTYADHARRQLDSLGGAKAAEDLAYWKKALDGDLPVLALPTDRPRPAVMTSNGRALFRTLSPELSESVRGFGRKRRCTLFMTLLAGYAAALGRVTGQTDLVVGTPMSDRTPPYEDVVGFFVNTLALRLDLSGDPDFGTLLDRVRAVALDAYDHADVPFEAVVRELTPARALDRTPVFQTLAEFEPGDPFRFDLPGVRATPLDSGPDKALTDLSVYFTDQPDGIRCHLEYNTDLFDEATVDALFGTFRDVLAEAVGDAWWRGRVRQRTRSTVHALTSRWAEAAPDRTAVISGSGTLTYRELDQRAERLAAVLRGRDGGGAPVALWLPRGADLIVAMLAALKSGHGYVPLDPGQGRARAETILAESGTRILVVNGEGEEPADARPTLPPGTAVVDAAARTAPGPSTYSAPAPRSAPGPESLCFAIYTSGSTGTPKGVAVPHRAVVDLCQWHHERFGFTADDRSAAVCSQGFDAAALEIWPALTAGATVVVADETVRKDPAVLARWYADRKITFSILPTALGEAVLALPDDLQPPLRHLLLGGDVLRTRPRPGAPYETVNVYGPTETTVLCTTHTVEPAGTGDEPIAPIAPIPIGRPIDNVTLRILDARGREVPAGEAGELYVGGPGVATGYLGRPDLTAERFVRDPLGGTEPMYRTGDLVRRDESGVLEFLGRSDDQVKIRGYRVEPEEVTRALNGCAGVAEAVVLPRRDQRGEARLGAYVVPVTPTARHQELADRLTEELAARLPDHLVPRAWAVLPALPLSGNGKLDRTALPAPALITSPTGPGGPCEAPAAATPVSPAHPAPPAPRDVEARLRELWAAEFELDAGAVGPDASFFELGGHSLTAIRLANSVREEFGVEYPVARFYEEPTLRAMAAYLADGTDGDPGDVLGSAPVTAQQSAFITRHLTHPRPQIYNVAMRLTFTGTLDVPALRTALTGLVARHEALRTRLVEDAVTGEWRQEALRPRPVELPEEDLVARLGSEAEAAAEGERLAAETAAEPFDIRAELAPVLRLLRTGHDRWALLFVLHHAACDGWSVSVLLRELAALYRAAVTGTPHGLAVSVPQPGEYARWQREHGRTQDRGRLVDYWARELEGAPFGLALPLDRPRPEKLSGAGDVVLFTVEPAVRAGVEAMARRHRTTPFVVTAAALGRLVAEVTGEPDVLLAISYANRERREFEALAACTVSSFTLRIRGDEATSFGALVDQVARGAVGAIDHAAPIRTVAAELTEALGTEVPDRLPLGFQYQSSLETDIELPGVTTAVEDLAVPGARSEFNFGLIPTGDVLSGYLEYSTDLWDRATVEAWTGAYVALLAEGVAAAAEGES
ncbi:MupA/Atu3671 family FMN-dependent luciferase-like monooxygenase [Streptomyces sp. KN37]|uniref:MupA/Atu3671 family FMN-dependent luciferase-like monooxygenase n=1 Tax=Streptomyces sp. KN37 TaxID=3090667 RepID=UPI002A756040|nr:MupA/Atu3671 family FMN-dependent luciferase-like monooxygenase [Streptomyces sp. KN37]WPO74136.1 amino acid adenylation domain-containing protein [Streptomyces sp. KN37]